MRPCGNCEQGAPFTGEYDVTRQCRRCWLYHNDPAYRRLWGGNETAALPPDLHLTVFEDPPVPGGRKIAGSYWLGRGESGQIWEGDYNPRGMPAAALRLTRDGDGFTLESGALAPGRVTLEPWQGDPRSLDPKTFCLVGTASLSPEYGAVSVRLVVTR